MSVAQKRFYLTYPIDSATMKYQKLGDMLDQSRRGWLKTSGSSTTVTAVTPAVGTLASARPADQVWFVLSQALTARKIATVVDADNVTINTAIDLTAAGVPWYLSQASIGSTDADGWHSAFMYPDGVSILINVINMGTVTGGIDISIETKGGGDVTAPIVIWAQNLTTVGNVKVDLTVPVEYVRVGVKAGAGAGSGSSISVEMVGMIAN